MAVAQREPTVLEAIHGLDRRAIVCVLGVWLTVVAAFAFQINDPWWGAMAAFRVSLRDPYASEYMRRNRFIGTFVGCGLGFVISGLILDNRVLIIAATFVLAVVGTYRRFTAGAAYGWLVGALSAVLVINAAILEPNDAFSFFLYRSLETFIAVAVIGIVERCFLPPLQEHRYKLPPQPSEDQRQEFAIVAAAAGFTVVILSIIWINLDLPQYLQVLATTLAVFNTTVTAQKAKSFQRFSGVVIGGAIGLVVAALSVQSFILWSAIFLLGMAGFAAYATSSRKDSYIGVQAGYGFLMATVTGNGPITEIVPVLDRMLGITFGVIVAYIVLRCAFAVFGKEDA